MPWPERSVVQHLPLQRVGAIRLTSNQVHGCRAWAQWWCARDSRQILGSNGIENDERLWLIPFEWNPLGTCVYKNWSRSQIQFGKVACTRTLYHGFSFAVLTNGVRDISGQRPAGCLETGVANSGS